MLEVEHLRFSYGKREVLRGVDLRVEPGELVFVLGANGAGKTTLFRCILGLLPGYQGCVRVDGCDVSSLAPRALAKKIAYIPQTSHMIFPYTALELVLMGTNRRLGLFSAPGRRERAIAMEALEELGIANIGVFATAASLMGWVARPALGILLDKKGPIATLIPAGLFFSAGLLCLAFAQDLTWFIISGILIGIGQNGISPVLMTISMRTVPAERKAAANSTNYLGMDIGSALASTVGGVLCAVFGYRVGFAAFVVPVVLAVALAVVILSRLEKQERTA